MAIDSLIGAFVGPLEREGIEYAIAGSVASIAYGEPRMTMDIDMVAALGRDAMPRLLRADAPPAGAGTATSTETKEARPTAAASAAWPIPEDTLVRKLSVPSQGRLYFVRYALKMGWSVDRVHEVTRIDRWFLRQFAELVAFEDRIIAVPSLEACPRELMFEAKRLGYSDAQLANAWFGEISSKSILAVRAARKRMGIEPVFKLVDTCAAEFEAVTPYYYSTYEAPYSVGGRPHLDDEARVSATPKVIILGGGPNRIGQGIEFDYCCCQASFAAREMGLESVMINSNPETVSTDFDTSDLLFFEPLTLEDV
ncbi:MAG: hypothetical protein ACKOTD_07605, partial [Phycisphaerales bacterium]